MVMSKQKASSIQALTNWIVTRPAEIAMVLSLCLGYLAGVLAASHLTALNFFAFTMVNMLYGGCALLLTKAREQSLWPILWAIALTLLTAASGLLALSGIWFNWLLYFVTVALYFTYLPFSRASIFFIVLYVLVVGNSYLLDMGQPLSHLDWHTLLAGFIFTSAFSFSNRLLHIERSRSRRLFHQLETSKQELEQAHTQLQQYTNEVEELTVIRERTRLAREIHDTLGHYLTIITIQLETISKLFGRDPAQALNEVEEARKVAAQAMQEVRNAVTALRPGGAAQLQPLEAFNHLGDEFRRGAPGVELVLDLDTALPPLTMEIQHTLYRVAQESLTNVRKHAQATKVLVRLRYEQETVELLVRDNGKGQEQEGKEQLTGGFGLVGLRERVELLGGQVSFGPIEPTGYRVLVRIPSPQKALERPLASEQGSSL